MKACWLTDIHLDHCQDLAKREILKQRVNYLSPDVVFITGDISNAQMLRADLTWLSNAWPNTKIYFCLGNHDIWGSSFEAVGSLVKTLCKERDNLIWIDKAGPVNLTENTILIGNGLWYDWRAGNWQKSDVILNDFALITDLNRINSYYHYTKKEWAIETNKVVKRIADDFTKSLIKDLKLAIKQKPKEIMLLSHIPPFYKAAFHDGKLQDDDWAPHFTCVIAGEKIEEVMKDHLDINLTCLFGHTHGRGAVQITENIRAINGGAVYTSPAPQLPIEIL